MHRDICTVIKNRQCYIAVFYEHDKKENLKKPQKTTFNYKKPFVWDFHKKKRVFSNPGLTGLEAQVCKSLKYTHETKREREWQREVREGK